MDVAARARLARAARRGRCGRRARGRLWSLDLDSGSVERLADVTGGDARVALNDGRCDGAGQFWVGSYARNERDAVGGVFRVGTDRTVTRVVSSITVGNGLDWSPDGGTLYFTDSAGTITAFDMEEGLPVRPRVFARDDDCSPDGLVVDAAAAVCRAPSGTGGGSSGTHRTAASIASSSSRSSGRRPPRSAARAGHAVRDQRDLRSRCGRSRRPTAGRARVRARYRRSRRPTTLFGG